MGRVLGDRVRCINCGPPGVADPFFVEVGEDQCPRCGEAGTLAWAPERGEPVDSEVEVDESELETATEPEPVVPWRKLDLYAVAVHEDGEPGAWVFLCRAESTDHALAQARDHGPDVIAHSAANVSEYLRREYVDFMTRHDERAGGRR